MISMWILYHKTKPEGEGYETILFCTRRPPGAVTRKAGLRNAAMLQA